MAATPAVRIAQPTPWPAWLGVAACGVLAIATGLDWLSTGGFSADAFDIAFGALFSDTAVDGISIAVVLVILAALGIAVGLLAPRAGTLGVALLIVGVLGTLIVGWYMIRILTSDGGSASLFSIGLYLALAGALAVVVSGAVLSASGKRRAA